MWGGVIKNIYLKSTRINGHFHFWHYLCYLERQHVHTLKIRKL